jgi:hypothetical protein
MVSLLFFKWQAQQLSVQMLVLESMLAVTFKVWQVNHPKMRLNVWYAYLITLYFLLQGTHSLESRVATKVNMLSYFYLLLIIHSSKCFKLIATKMVHVKICQVCLRLLHVCWNTLRLAPNTISLSFWTKRIQGNTTIGTQSCNNCYCKCFCLLLCLINVRDI